MKPGKKGPADDDSSASSDMFAVSDQEDDNQTGDIRGGNAVPGSGADGQGGDDDISVGSTSSTEDVTVSSSPYLNKRIAKSFSTHGIFFGTVIQCIRRVVRKRNDGSDDKNEASESSPDKPSHTGDNDATAKDEEVLYYIAYDDGDKEELYLSELKRALLLYRFKQYRDPKRKSGREVASPTPQDARKAKCDICMKVDGFQHLNLLTCLHCNVHVHGDCYGIPTYKEKDFVCWACQAVGEYIPIEGDTEPGQDGLRCLKQTERPWICELCHHNPPIDTTASSNGGNGDGSDKPPTSVQIPRAMHPLYDTHGLRARQKVVEGVTDQVSQKAGQTPKSKKRLAWAHSLCAFMLTKHNMLYGTQANGTTHDGVEEDDVDERPLNPYLQKVDQLIQDDADYGAAAPLHHFVYPSRRNTTQLSQPSQSSTASSGDKDNVRTRSGTGTNSKTRKGRQKLATIKAIQLIEEFQIQSCCICKPESEKGNEAVSVGIGGRLQIPVQCSANDPDEYHEYKFTHRATLRDDEVCTVPLHVGCARWGSSISGVSAPKTRVLFFPGNKVYGEPVKMAYCSLHAKDIKKERQDEVKQLEDKKAQQSRSKRKRLMGAKYGEESLILAPDEKGSGNQEKPMKKMKRLMPKSRSHEEEPSPAKESGSGLSKEQEGQLEKIRRRLEKEIAQGLIDTVGVIDNFEGRTAELKKQKKRWIDVAVRETSNIVANLPSKWFSSMWTTAKNELASAITDKQK